MISLNKDIRSIMVSLLLGDGCLYRSGKKNSVYFQIIHGDSQADYISWKRDLINLTVPDCRVKIKSSIVYTNNKPFVRHKIALSRTRFRAWKKFFYPGGKKDISKMLRFIRHPELALAIWLMDDGTVNYTKNKNNACLRLHTDSEKIESVQKCIDYLNTTFNFNLKLYMRKHGAKNNFKQYPIIRFNTQDSLTAWKIIREFVLKFKSMQHKFRHLELKYQKSILQRVPDRRFKSAKSDDIVQSTSNSTN